MIDALASLAAMTQLRAGLAGLGMMGKNHARVLQSMDNVELVGAADGYGDRFGAMGDLPVFGSIDELIEHGIDLCVVALPTETHLDAGLKLASVGVHALIEKPLAMNVAECDQLVAAFTEAGLIAAVGHIERFNPALQAARTRIEAGDLGDIYQVATRRQGPFPNRIRDVGVIKDLATHDVDLTAWVAGAPFAEITARVAHKSGREHEDMVAATGTLTSGVITNHLVNWLSPMKERVTVITGERGCFIADTLTADLTFCANGEVPTEWDAVANFRGVTEGDVTRLAIPKPEPLRVELEAFRDGILGKSDDYVPIGDGRLAVAVADACIASAASGTTQAIPGASA